MHRALHNGIKGQFPCVVGGPGEGVRIPEEDFRAFRTGIVDRAEHWPVQLINKAATGAAVKSNSL